MDPEQSLAQSLSAEMALARLPGVPEPVYNKAEGGVGKEGN